VSIWGVSECRAVRRRAATAPMRSMKAFLPVTGSTRTAERSRLPRCCESCNTFAEYCSTNAVVIWVLIESPP
jgi:hypothetical protein